MRSLASGATAVVLSLLSAHAVTAQTIPSSENSAVARRALDTAWEQLATFRGKKIIVTRTDGSEVRGRLLQLQGDVLTLGEKGLAAEATKQDVVVIKHNRKSYWYVWLLGGALAGSIISCATTSDFGGCFSDEGTVATNERARVTLISLAIFGASIYGSVAMGKDKVVYPMDRLRVGFVPQRDGRLALAASVRF